MCDHSAREKRTGRTQKYSVRSVTEHSAAAARRPSRSFARARCRSRGRDGRPSAPTRAPRRPTSVLTFPSRRSACTCRSRPRRRRRCTGLRRTRARNDYIKHYTVVVARLRAYRRHAASIPSIRPRRYRRGRTASFRGHSRRRAPIRRRSASRRRRPMIRMRRACTRGAERRDERC